MAGGTVQESPPSGLCLYNTKITCWEDLAAGAYTTGRVHGCLQALRFMLTWKYRRKVLCVVPDYRLRICTCCYGFQADSGILSRTVVPLNFAHASNGMSRNKFVGGRLPTFFCSLPGSLQNLVCWLFSSETALLSPKAQTHRCLGVHRVGVSYKSCSDSLVRVWIHGIVELVFSPSLCFRKMTEHNPSEAFLKWTKLYIYISKKRYSHIRNYTSEYVYSFSRQQVCLHLLIN